MDLSLILVVLLLFFYCALHLCNTTVQISLMLLFQAIISKDAMFYDSLKYTLVTGCNVNPESYDLSGSMGYCVPCGTVL
jgi:hypothetical protein